MKKALAFLLIIIMLAGCSEASPAESVQIFYGYASSGQIDKAKPFVAEETRELFGKGSMYGTLSAGITREGKKYIDVEPIESNVNGQTATVRVRVTYHNKTSEEKDMNLLREGGAWRLTFQ